MLGSVTVKSKWYVADFETTSYKFYNRNGYTKVWLFGLCDSDCNIIKIGTSIEEFMIEARKLYGKIIYFHNLKFDGTFILDWLMNNGFTYYEDLDKVDKGFTTLIGDMGEFYSLTVKFSKGKQVHFYDSLKVLPFKVEKLAKDFHMEIEKEEIDYDKYEINAKTIIYQIHDVKIVATALKAIKEEGMTKMTTASCAYNSYTDMFQQEWLDYKFPDLGTEWLIEWRKAYRGGRSQVNPLYQGKILHNVKRFDINSMYPWVMHDMPLPYGMPIECKEPGNFKFELYKIDIEFNLKDGCLPSLLKKNNLYKEDSYYVTTDGIEEMYISNIDLDLVRRNYNITYLKFNKIYGFKTSVLMFRQYVDKWYSKKAVDKGAQRIVDKLMLNSFYGKYGSNPVGKHKIPVMKDNVLTYINSEDEPMKHYYLPVAIAVTSWAHKKIDDGIHMTGIENFVYVDTDSIHTLGSLPNDEVDQKALGKYKLEGIEETSKYVRQKCYVYTQDGEYTITCAGMTQDMKDAAIRQYGKYIFEEFKEGFTIGGKLVPKRVKGGTILNETTFTIN